MSVFEVAERKNGMGMDSNEWIENIDANRNEKQRRSESMESRGFAPIFSDYLNED